MHTIVHRIMRRTATRLVVALLGAGALELGAGTGSTAPWVPGNPVPPGWVVLPDAGSAAPGEPFGGERILDLRGAGTWDTVDIAGVSSIPPGWAVVDCWSQIQERVGSAGFRHRYLSLCRIRNLKGAPVGSRETITLNPPVPPGWEIVGGNIDRMNRMTFIIEKLREADGEMAGENVASSLTYSPMADYVLEDLEWSSD